MKPRKKAVISYKAKREKEVITFSCWNRGFWRVRVMKIWLDAVTL